MRFIVCGFIVLLPLQAHAAELAEQLGFVLASEQLCGLTYDSAAVSSFIEKNVAADDMEFGPRLRVVISYEKAMMEALSGSQKTAQCVQIARVAKSLGFLK
jgi:hypothetical protein